MAKKAKKVEITASGYSPDSVTAKVGETVCFTNSDTAPHTVTFDDPAIAGASDIAPGATWDYECSTAGEFPFHCDKCPEMKGTITVS